MHRVNPDKKVRRLTARFHDKNQDKSADYGPHRVIYLTEVKDDAE
jgi:hypothetical protein